MPNQADLICGKCPHRVNCDFLAGFCNLSASEVVRYRPDLITDADAHQRAIEAGQAISAALRELRVKRIFIPDRSMAVRYDKRRKKDSPRRQWERAYRARKRAE